MPDQIYVETTPSGHRQFVVRRHSSHHHHHHRRSHDRDHITQDEMNNLLERERHLREANEALVRENHALKANWQACDYELRRIQPLIPQFQAQIRALEHDNRELRHSLDTNSDASERLREVRIKYTKVKNENEGLRQTIRHLKSQLQELIDERISRLLETVHVLKEEVKEWRRRYEEVGRSYEDIRNRYQRVRDGLDAANEKNAELQAENDGLRRSMLVYERILRRHRLL